ncbi:DUF523 domain-containing protein [Aliikangiella marina]|nr:DUF523 domain-containing protein [Aliikangiella marina]
MHQDYSQKPRPLIGISSCLMGQKVRYDGEHQYQPLIHQYLTTTFNVMTFCPEMAIGLGVPRPKIQLVERNRQIICLDQATETLDYTQKLAACCDSQSSWLEQICGYVFKTKSPSCGVSKVKTRRGNALVADGQGIFATELMRRYPELPVIEEDQLADKHVRENFIQAAISYRPQISPR